MEKRKNEIGIFYLFVSVGWIILFVVKNLIVLNDIANNVLSYIMCGALTFLLGSLIFFMKRKLFLLSSVLITAFCIIILFSINLLTIKTSMTFTLLFFTVCLIYSLILMFIFLFKKNKNCIINSGIIALLGICLLIKNSSKVSHILIMQRGEYEIVFPIIALTIALIAGILYLILRKDRTDKGNYYGALLGIVSCCFLCTLFIPTNIYEGINYCFDQSTPIEVSFQIINKSTKSGYKSGPSYRFTILIDDEEKLVFVSNVVYGKYSVNDLIQYNEHEGFLGLSYYELVDDK